MRERCIFHLEEWRKPQQEDSVAGFSFNCAFLQCSGVKISALKKNSSLVSDDHRMLLSYSHLRWSLVDSQFVLCSDLNPPLPRPATPCKARHTPTTHYTRLPPKSTWASLADGLSEKTAAAEIHLRDRSRHVARTAPEPETSLHSLSLICSFQTCFFLFHFIDVCLVLQLKNEMLISSTIFYSGGTSKLVMGHSWFPHFLSLSFKMSNFFVAWMKEGHTRLVCAALWITPSFIDDNKREQRSSILYLWRGTWFRTVL